MKRTYGEMPTTMQAGYFKAVRFEPLMLLDTETGDGRIFDSAGAGVRPLPLSIRNQPASLPAHAGAVPTGALFEVTIDDEAGTVTGRGFLLDDENGRYHARLIHLGAQFTNSADLADIEARWEMDLDTGHERIRFAKFNLAATTGVGTPAFAVAHAEVDPLTDAELMASIIGDDPMEELVASCAGYNLVGVPEPELVADGAVKLPFDAFYVPETDHIQKIIVTEDGRVYGHLGSWDSCHDGIEGQCVIIPRPRDGYASFNQPGPLTERGQVQTGPIFFLGGHPDGGLNGISVAKAYGGVENTWCDVRVIEGRLGPWLSGYIRPGTSENALHVARCSRISGHWKGDRLVGIVSCNVPGFNTPGLPEGEFDLAAAFAFRLNDDGVTELVASFPTCGEPEPEALELTITLPPGASGEAILEAIQTALANGTPLEAAALDVDEDDSAILAELDDTIVLELMPTAEV